MPSARSSHDAWLGARTSADTAIGVLRGDPTRRPAGVSTAVRGVQQSELPTGLATTGLSRVVYDLGCRRPVNIHTGNDQAGSPGLLGPRRGLGDPLSSLEVCRVFLNGSVGRCAGTGDGNTACSHREPSGRLLRLLIVRLTLSIRSRTAF
jgi:hypothetical protein